MKGERSYCFQVETKRLFLPCPHQGPFCPTDTLGEVTAKGPERPGCCPEALPAVSGARLGPVFHLFRDSLKVTTETELGAHSSPSTWNKTQMPVSDASDEDWSPPAPSLSLCPQPPHPGSWKSSAPLVSEAGPSALPAQGGSESTALRSPSRGCGSYLRCSTHSQAGRREGAKASLHCNLLVRPAHPAVLIRIPGSTQPKGWAWK